MIGKLKKKFILINMLLTALVLNSCFIVIGVSTYRRLSAESQKALETSFAKVGSLSEPKSKLHAPPKAPSVLLESLIFNVKLSMDQEQLTLIGDNVDMEKDELKNLIDTCLEQKSSEGILSTYKLRYLIKEDTPGTEIAFYDLTNDLHTMVNLGISFIFVEIGGLTAFFLISLFLAKWSLKPLETSWNQQKQFVADASHELKTPLTVILANADILTAHKTDTIEQQSKWLNYIQAEATHMSKLVNDLLFLANADAQQEKPVYSKVNLSDIVWNCYLPFESVAFEQGKFLDSTIESDIYVNGDEGKLKQLILILLDNACKYTDKNRHIEVLLKQKQDKVQFSVTNFGTPIPTTHLPHIFERFYRVDESRTREVGGYGLGLSIAKTITDMHNGKISVTSSLEAGTTFTALFSLYK